MYHLAYYTLKVLDFWLLLQHAAIPDFDGSTSFFAVYDGHGG